MPDSTGNVASFRRRHVSEAVARAFYANTLPEAEKAFVVRHLLSRCARCSEMMLRLGVELGVLAPSERDGLQVLNMESPEIGTRRIVGLAQWAFLRSVPEGRIPYINEHPEFHHLGLYERLIEMAKLEMRLDPFKAAEAAELAVAVARNLKVTRGLRNDYLATATAIRGNASRLAADFTGAEISFAVAWALREEGTPDPLVDALIYRYEGAYFCELGRYEEAEQSLSNALAEYSHIGDEHLQGRTLLSLADTAVYYDPMKAIEYLGRANVLYDTSVEPFLAWCSRHIEICCLNEMQQPDAALALLEESRDLYRQFGLTDVWVRLRGYWIEARIAHSMGHFQEAESILSMLFEQLDQEGRHPVDLTLIAVDLLQAVSAQENRQGDVIAFSDKLLPVLRNLGLHDQGRAVMLMLRDALVSRAIDGAGWQLIKNYFRRNWHTPLPLQPQLD